MHFNLVMILWWSDLLTVAFSAATLIRGKRLLEADAYSELSVYDAIRIRGRRLFEAQRLLEQIRYIKIFLPYYSLYTRPSFRLDQCFPLIKSHSVVFRMISFMFLVSALEKAYQFCTKTHFLFVKVFCTWIA